MQAALPAALAMLPGTQTLGAAAPSAHADPGGHSWHQPCPGSPWNRPAAQREHVALSECLRQASGAGRLRVGILPRLTIWADRPSFFHLHAAAMAKRKREGNCLFVFARVCKGWRKAQLKVGGPLRTRVMSDVILPGSVALAKWALAEGCPRKAGRGFDMAYFAARYGHLELVKWLCGEGGFAMDERVMEGAACSGNLELVQWLRGEGCPWDNGTCKWAVNKGHVEVLRWARENGCPWGAATRDRAAAELGYTDDFGNLQPVG